MRPEEKTWFNQLLLHHKDSYYNSGGSFEVGLSSNTSDFKTFSSVSLNISITNGIKKVYNLNYQNAIDLMRSFKEVTDNIQKIFESTSSIDILKRYYSDKSLKVKFANLNGDYVTSLSIINNQSDFTEVIIPYSTVFIPFCLLLKSFIENFLKLNIDLSLRSTISESLTYITQIKDSIKTIPSSIISYVGDQGLITNTAENAEVAPTKARDSSELDSEMEQTYTELNNFLGEDMNNIIIPELNTLSVEKEKEIRIIESQFMNNVLKGDINTLEYMISSLSVVKNPLQTIYTTILSSITNLSDKFSFFPGTFDDEIKSYCYLSKSIYNYYFRRYSDHNTSIPSAIPALKVRVSSCTDENLNLAYDLLLILAYVRVLRSKLEIKESSCIKNKAIFYMGLRLFFDPFVFSFMDNKDPNIIKSCVLDRFKYYSKQGFFKSYSTLLDSYRITDITENEVMAIINQLAEKVFRKGVFVDILHNDYYNEKVLRIPSKNSLTLEQIIEDGIPLQSYVYSKITNLKDDEEFEKIISSYEGVISDPVSDAFLGKKRRENKEKESNIVRASKFYSTDIPEEFRNDFIEHVKNIGNFDYDFENDKFTIEEFKDNIIKVLYVWNESEKNITYTEFMTKIEECVLSKDLILTKYKSQKVVSDSDESWVDLLN